ncbi:polysaccharide deacetylase family protein [Chachezhania sediminis]|uniref:polysaccharide deacetylase family protein n=1 Tax=Chachezhania sediminis TaxID=2599291 RepID=UPI002D80201A|nr:polysaccharide deacetylase family protein [Chachezhania sediminis]
MSMAIDWTPLDAELDLWAAEGRVLPFWWRDDDAVSDTPELQRMVALADGAGLPVHLAVIPAHADRRLVARVVVEDALVPLVHGWRHESHAPLTQKKAEFGDHRPPGIWLDDARDALWRMEELFNRDLLPVFVPPWNRVAPEVVEGLAGLGYRAISTYLPRKRPMSAPGLVQVNTHLDPVAWKTTRALADPSALVAGMALDMAARRAGTVDATEPFGLLTHHLIHDDDVWDFVAALLARLSAGPVRFCRLEQELNLEDGQ